MKEKSLVYRPVPALFTNYKHVLNLSPFTPSLPHGVHTSLALGDSKPLAKWASSPPVSPKPAPLATHARDTRPRPPGRAPRYLDGCQHCRRPSASPSNPPPTQLSLSQASITWPRPSSTSSPIKLTPSPFASCPNCRRSPPPSLASSGLPPIAPLRPYIAEARYPATFLEPQ